MKRKILVIRFSSLGDVILTTPATRALKECYSDSELHVLVKKEFADIFKGSPYVDRVIKFDAKKVSSPRKLLRFAKDLNSEGYSFVIDLHRSLRSRVICFLLDAEQKLYYKKESLQRRLLVGLKIRFKGMPHTVDKYLTALRPLGIRSADRLPFVFTSSADEEYADDFFSGNKIKDHHRVIAVSPGARNMAKMYPKEKFSDLIDMITNIENTRVIIIGSKSDKNTINSIYKSVKTPGKVSTVVSGSINKSAAIIKRCSDFVTNDSGAMHLAVAVGTPVVALFGPTDRDFGFYPLGENDTVITKGYDCSPCSLHGKKECSKHNYKCLNDITPKEIFSKLIV